jgi:hypothetical protein
MKWWWGPLCTIPTRNHFLLFLLSVACLATNTNFIVFGLTWSGLEPTIYHTRGQHANHTVVEWLLFNAKCDIFSYFMARRSYIQLDDYNVCFVLQFYWQHLLVQIFCTNSVAANRTNFFKNRAGLTIFRIWLIIYQHAWTLFIK